MIALVLVGGEGTRLRPITYDIPKPMLPIVGRPMVARVIEWLGHYGVERVVFSLGYRPDAFADAFPTGKWAGVEVEYAIEPEPLDTAGAIRFASMEAGVDDTLIVVNGDILTDLDLSKLVAFHQTHEADATIALTPVEDPSVYGVVTTTEEGCVKAFIEKPRRDEAPSNLVNVGTYVLEPSVLHSIRPGDRVSIEREVFPDLVAKRGLYALSSDCYWLDTGTPERYLQAQLDVLKGNRPDAVLPDITDFTPGTRLGLGAIFGGICGGHVFAGDGATVALGAYVEDSVISEGVTVEAGARVVGSVVLAGASIKKDAIVESSIIGRGATIGTAAVIRAWSVIGAGMVVDDGVHLDGARVPL